MKDPVWDLGSVGGGMAGVPYVDFERRISGEMDEHISAAGMVASLPVAAYFPFTGMRSPMRRLIRIRGSAVMEVPGFFEPSSLNPRRNTSGNATAG
jgi:hypothetical protein